MKKNKIFLLCVFCFLLIPNLLSAQCPVETAVVPVVYQLKVENEVNFNFDNLSATLSINQALTSCQNTTFKPDKNGILRFSLPKDSKASIVIYSKDPTLLSSAFDFYSIREKQSRSIFQEELIIPEFPPASIYKFISLQIGGAFKLCLTKDHQLSSIQFRQLSSNDRGIINLITFSEPYLEEEMYIGGLQKGVWNVIFVNDKDEKVKTLSLTIESGRILGCIQ